MSDPAADEASLRPGEPLGVGLRRVAHEQLDRLGHAVVGIGADPDISVHTARKTLKRLRALLRLVRDADRAAFRRQNAALRDLGRRLSATRDSYVLLLTFDQLGVDAPAVRERLAAGHEDAAARVRADGGLTSDTTRVIESARAELGGCKLADSFATIAPGLHRIYRQGRAGLEQVTLSGDESAYHEWRKRVKDLRYQLEAFVRLAPDRLGPEVVSLDELGNLLGLEHDLALLEEMAAGHESLTAATRRARRDHQARAAAIGAARYAEEPDEFVARINATWDAGRPG